MSNSFDEKWQQLAKECIEDFFKINGIKYSQYANLGLWLSRYYNFRLKYIAVEEKQLRVSKELSEKLPTHVCTHACFDIFHKAGTGVTINPYQSKGLINADVHDRLFNDWGIHHLHLSTTKKPNEFFYDRSDYLLIVRFTEDFAYFIDIVLHKEKDLWSLTDYIRILQNNWPNLLAKYETPGKTWTPNLNDNEIGVLRKKGYLFGINVDDKSYMMLNHGYAISGDNMMAGRLGNEFIRWGYKNRDLAEYYPQEFKAALKQQLEIIDE